MVTMAEISNFVLSELFNTGNNTTLYPSLVDFLLESEEGQELFLDFANKTITEDSFISLDDVLRVIHNQIYQINFDGFTIEGIKDYYIELFMENKSEQQQLKAKAFYQNNHPDLLVGTKWQVEVE